MGDITFGPNGWGLEHLTPIERAQIVIETGIDQFGGERNTALIEELVHSGPVTKSASISQRTASCTRSSSSDCSIIVMSTSTPRDARAVQPRSTKEWRRRVLNSAALRHRRRYA